ncbi:MAG: FtsB family cell division protein [Pseudonocardiaceae bacterium]
MVSADGDGAPRARWAGEGVAVRLGRAAGMTSPRRVAALAVLVAALGLSVAVPLQNYVGVQGELAAVRDDQTRLADQVAELERRRALLEKPVHVEAQARERLRYVRPGETPYIVQLPPPAAVVPAPEPEVPWFTRLWRSLQGTP